MSVCIPIYNVEGVRAVLLEAGVCGLIGPVVAVGFGGCADPGLHVFVLGMALDLAKTQ